MAENRARRRWKMLSSAVLGRDVARHGSVREFSTYHLLRFRATTDPWNLVSIPHLSVDPGLVVRAPTGSSVDIDSLVGFNNTGNVCIWPSEEVAAFWCSRRPHLFAGKTVLELGAGSTGLAGLLVALTARPLLVAVTDGNVEAVNNIRSILARNFCLLSHLPVFFSVYRWGTESLCLHLCQSVFNSVSDGCQLFETDNNCRFDMDESKTGHDFSFNRFSTTSSNDNTVGSDDTERLLENTRDFSDLSDSTKEHSINISSVTKTGSVASNPPYATPNGASDEPNDRIDGRYRSIANDDSSLTDNVPNKFFDVIIANDCFFFDESRELLVDSVARFLRVGGVAYFFAPSREGTLDKFVNRLCGTGLFDVSVGDNYDDHVTEAYGRCSTEVSNIFVKELHYPLLVTAVRRR